MYIKKKRFFGFYGESFAMEAYLPHLQRVKKLLKNIVRQLEIQASFWCAVVASITQIFIDLFFKFA